VTSALAIVSISISTSTSTSEAVRTAACRMAHSGVELEVEEQIVDRDYVQEALQLARDLELLERLVHLFARRDLDVLEGEDFVVGASAHAHDLAEAAFAEFLEVLVARVTDDLGRAGEVLAAHLLGPAEEHDGDEDGDGDGDADDGALGQKWRDRHVVARRRSCRVRRCARRCRRNCGIVADRGENRPQTVQDVVRSAGFLGVLSAYWIDGGIIRVLEADVERELVFADSEHRRAAIVGEGPGAGGVFVGHAGEGACNAPGAGLGGDVALLDHCLVDGGVDSQTEESADVAVCRNERSSPVEFRF
jgi:hypothetical protein